VSLSFPLAAGETFVSATAPCTQAAGTVTCNEGTIASAFGTTITIKATVAAAGNYTTTANGFLFDDRPLHEQQHFYGHIARADRCLRYAGQ